MTNEQEAVFARLRSILARYAAGFVVGDDSPKRHGLEGKPGPATLKAWKGRMRSEHVPVGWVEPAKATIGYHLMGVCGNPKLEAELSKALDARRQGKTCFHFATVDEVLFAELDQVTAKALAGMKRAGFVAE